MAFIEIQAVSKTFTVNGTVRHVLEDINLTVERGEFVSIVGFMGCGKSTFLNLVAGLIQADGGRVAIDGDLVRGVRKEAAYVFQNYSLLPWLSAIGNVQLAVASAFPEWTHEQQVAQSRRYLELVGLGNALHRRPGQLSGGMRQRVAIARAFASEPEMLFLDEPFGALDALTRGNLQQELAELCSAVGRPVTTIMITNSVEEALLLSDRIVPMTAGPRATMGPPVTIAIPKPRTIGQLQHDDEALRVRAHVVECLTEYVKHARHRPKHVTRSTRVNAGDTKEKPRAFDPPRPPRSRWWRGHSEKTGLPMENET
jgi:nitrate/nitrite transport system ATP-binding protein